MSNRHLRVRVDLAIPIPDSYTGSSVVDAINAMPAAVKSRVLALRTALQQAKADAQSIGWEDTVATKVHICAHSCGGSCPPDVDV